MQIPLSTGDPAALAEVGGKAASLIRLRQADFNVPDGFVLCTTFFAPWIRAVESSPAWQSVLAALGDIRSTHPTRDERERLERTCGQAKDFAASLPLGSEQQAALDQARARLGGGSYAVRSSSPEEDLAGASFAGLYETVLNVAPDGLLPAVRECFRSCLDARVLLYKREMGFDDPSPAIAVIVQRQVASETAGVAFSLNPGTNDFDEVLINASWGLGEALVSGEISPDAIVVDKLAGTIIERRRGDKGGVRPDEDCLDAARVEELTATVTRIETLYGEPVDVEWATDGDTVHVLQARPITTYVPLAEGLQTEPGARRNLYFDRSLADGLTMSGAMSPLTMDTIEHPARYLFALIGNQDPEDFDLADAGIFVSGGRLYANLSIFLHMARPETYASLMESVNTTLGDILGAVDLEQYKTATRPDFLRIRALVRHFPRVLWLLRSVLWEALQPVLNARRFDRRYDALLGDYDVWVNRPIDFSQPFLDQVLEELWKFWEVTEKTTLPAVLALILAMNRIKSFNQPPTPEKAALLDAVRRGYTEDIVVQMGLQMFDLSRLLREADLADIDGLAERLADRTLPGEFLSLWDEFIARYGCRGPLEMELANPRYADEPRLALRQIATIGATGARVNPHETQRELVEARERAFETLQDTLPRRKARGLRKAYADLLRHSRSREMVKHHILQVFQRIRTRALHHADDLVRAGRLEHRDQVFDLAYREIDRAMEDPRFDVQAAAIARGALYHRLKARVKHFPMAIDSRGRIPRPDFDDADGTIAGTAVSPGIARGPVKILNDPFEKDVAPGDVLVAVTTDPGWTPLFINAAAVLLEIGGELQHGALVAREYGKPCVVGVTAITARLRDGQLVEVNGDVGRVQILSEAEGDSRH